MAIRLWKTFTLLQLKMYEEQNGMLNIFFDTRTSKLSIMSEMRYKHFKVNRYFIINKGNLATEIPKQSMHIH